MEFNLRKADDFSSRFARITIMGDAGSGKTTLASTLPDLKKTLLINVKGYEDGDISLSNYSDLTILDIKSIPEWIKLVEQLPINPMFKDFEFIVIDSITGLSSMSIEYFEGFHADRKGNAIFELYREHGEMLRDSLLKLKNVNKHIFITALTKVSEDKLGTGSVVPRIDGQMVTNPLNAWMDGTICIKAYEDGSRAILLQNNGTYACKLRVCGGTPMALKNKEDISLTKILNLMGFKFNTKGVK